MPDMFTLMTRESFEEMTTLPDEYRGKLVFVLGGTGEADFYALGRKNIDNVLEWMIIADEFKIAIGSGGVFTNLGVGPTAISSAVFLNLEGYTEMRFGLKVLIAGVTGEVRLRYRDDQASAFVNLTTNTIPLSATGVFYSNWEPIPAGAKGPIMVFVYGLNGNGTEDPEIFAIVARFRR